MAYNVPDKGGNASYIIRNETGYPEKIEEYITEFAQLLTDINNDGIAQIPSVNTGAEYFNYISNNLGGGGGAPENILYSSATLTIDDSNIANYNNKVLVYNGSAALTITFNISNRSSIPDPFRMEVLNDSYYEVRIQSYNNYLNGVDETGITLTGTNFFLYKRLDKCEISYMPEIIAEEIEFLLVSPYLQELAF